MDLDALGIFLEVVRTGSFLSASTSLGIPRPTLRRRCDELEARTGVRLLVRTRQGVVATEAGKVLASRAESILADAASLVGAVREVGSDAAGRLRVAAPPGLPPHLFAPFFSFLRSAFPKIEIELRVGMDPALAPVDADIILSLAIEPPPGAWLSYDLVPAPEQLIVSKAYLKEHGMPREPVELTEHVLLAWQPPDRDPRVWPLCDLGELDVQPWFVSTDIFVVRCMAAQGLGIALVPNAALPLRAPGEEDLETILPEVGRTRSLSALVPHSRTESPRVRAALSILERIGWSTPRKM